MHPMKYGALARKVISIFSLLSLYLRFPRSLAEFIPGWVRGNAYISGGEFALGQVWVTTLERGNQWFKP